MNRRRWLALGWLTVLALSAALPLSAIFHGVIHVGPGTLVAPIPPDRPVVSFFSNVDLPHGSHSIVIVVAGDVRVSGTARDDVVALDGRVYLRSHAVARGDTLSILGGIYKSPTARSGGRLGGAIHRWDGRYVRERNPISSVIINSARLGLAAGLALILAGACLTIVFPWQIVLISTTLGSSLIKSLVAGIMCLLTFMFLVVPLGLSLAGLPFALLLSAAASLAWLFGMTAAAVSLGRTVARRPASLIWAAAAGLLLLAIAMAVPVVGPLAVTLVGLTGAGALAVALVDRSKPFASMG